MNDKAAYFDDIALGYEKLDTELTPIRSYSEVYTFQKLIGELNNTAVLEFACSDGFFTRIIKRGGAKSVLGIDISPDMIEIAKTSETNMPLGIDYLVGDIFKIPKLGIFDIVFTPFVMSYAANANELLKMCKAFFENLAPGGRLLSMNDNPYLLPDSVTGFEKYGKTKTATTPLEDGATIEVTWLAPDSDGTLHKVSFNCHYFTKETFEWALTEAGFTDIKMHFPEVSPEGIEKLGSDYWNLFIKHPLIVFIEARKPIS